MENQENPLENLDEQVLTELAKHTPWNVIAKRYHISTKTISQIRGKKTGVKSESEIAAQVFELFRRGMKPHNVVIRLRQHPEVVGKLFEQYKELTGHDNNFCSQCWKDSTDFAKSFYAVIEHPCSLCGKDLTWHLLEKKDKEQIMGMLKDGGIGNWYHTKCKKT